MQIIIPMVGKSIRFKKAGFKKVKEVRKEGMNFIFMETIKNLEKT